MALSANEGCAQQEHFLRTGGGEAAYAVVRGLLRPPLQMLPGPAFGTPKVSDKVSDHGEPSHVKERAQRATRSAKERAFPGASASERREMRVR